MSHVVIPGRAVRRPAPRWTITVYAVLAALAVCIVAVFYTPVEQPVALRSAESAVVSLGRHSAPGDGLTL